MTKQDLIDRIASQTGLTKRQAGQALNAVVDGIKGAMKKGERVTLVGFGTFFVAQRKSRTGRNPRTQQKINIPARKVPNFRAGKELKHLVR
ncbi:MAG: DNA-binding protein HU [Candidatus Coatesbacteria bacterium RBG_13_66_14]|jgi:DNA-binding protein HU-beta|uniref:DNA-binding protein HU n=1 Tax=Candidatus Coatesbacteria bacterium RBG_13_66_14 TaxID=1817816 RepID=A0A1F5FEP3_9BACT|nr:HU family DNA-binding protein [bacterium]OGD78079.1 MAG: DNA-binding protein HU [Candidatus Coatesbacteria bacterium RBG_13_66_14]HUT99296.1 HU family DNA-binding protein [bacterium]